MQKATNDVKSASLPMRPTKSQTAAGFAGAGFAGAGVAGAEIAGAGFAGAGDAGAEIGSLFLPCMPPSVVGQFTDKFIVDVIRHLAAGHGVLALGGTASPQGGHIEISLSSILRMSLHIGAGHSRRCERPVMLTHERCLLASLSSALSVGPSWT